VPFRPNPLTPFPAREGGKFWRGRCSPHEWGPKRWQTLSQRGWERGWRGRKPPPKGFGGCAPKIKKEGASCHISNPATSGTQNAGEPSAHEGGQTGVQGAKPPWRGVVGGVLPQNIKRERVAHISNPATSGTQNPGRPSAHEGGQTGVQGASPPGGGLWGVSPPQNLKRGRVAHISNPATSGTQNSGEPSASEGGQMGGPGDEAPLAWGLGDAPPKATVWEQNFAVV